MMFGICKPCYRLARGRGYSRSRARHYGHLCITERMHYLRAGSKVVEVKLDECGKDDINDLVSGAEDFLRMH